MVATKADELDGTAELRAAFPDLEVIGVSVLDEPTLELLRDAIWRLTGLVRVHLRDGDNPVALHPPVTVLDVANTIHHDLAARCTGARVWGPSARFPGQRVGRAHSLADGDTVEILD
jgi:ribosome-interacting GTPase 1